jgi:hypothetical protein
MVRNVRQPGGRRHLATSSSSYEDFDAEYATATEPTLRGREPAGRGDPGGHPGPEAANDVQRIIITRRFVERSPP